MEFTISVITDFYQCCNIPVKAVSYELDEIYKIGYNEYFEEIFPLNDIKSLINSCNNLINNHLEISNNLHYKVVSISKFDKYKGFFVLGPISSEKIDNNVHNIPHRTVECLNYISNLILNISEDKFDKNMNNKYFNPYIKKAIEYVHKNYDRDISVTSLCQHLNINKSYFCSIFKNGTGYTFSHFLNYFRVEKSKKLLQNTDLSLLDIAIAVGFNNQNYFSMVFKKFTNKTPFQYRASNYQEKIN